MALLAVPALTWSTLRPAYAADEKKEAEDASDEGGEGEEETGAPDPDQPAVIIGGNYGVENFPLGLVDETLTMPQGAVEVELDYDTDIRSPAGNTTQSFKTHTLTLLARYGATQTTEIKAGFLFDAAAPDGGIKDRQLGLAVEQAIVYDLLDVQGGVNIDFASYPEGVKSSTLFDVFVGLPFKYRLMPGKVAIVGLEKILVIHANTPEGADSTPDLLISAAGQAQILPQLALELRVSLNLAAASFDNRRLPVELTALYRLNHGFDLGLSITARNISPPSKPMVSTAGALDSLGLGLFVRGRFGS